MKFRSVWNPEKEYDVRIVLDQYTNGRLYVGLHAYDSEWGFWEPFTNMTVNLPNAHSSGADCAFLDTNNSPNIEQFVMENNLGKPTRNVAHSGYCSYPEYRFDMRNLKRLAAWNEEKE